MKIAIRFGPPMRAWEARLATALRNVGHEVECVVGGQGTRIPRDIEAALKLERRLFKVASSLFDLAPPPPPAAGEDYDLTIVLDGGDCSAENSLTPLFDDAAEEGALLRAIARSPTPTVRIRARSGGQERDLVRALLAVEHHDVLSRALDQVLARLVSLILQGVRRFEDGSDTPKVCLSEPAPRCRRGPRAFMARGLTRKIVGRVRGAAQGPNHWRIGFRAINGSGVAGARQWDDRCYAILADDGSRFYADPVPFEHDGRSFIFFENFPYATAKGMIGVVEVAADGRPSPPRTVLEQPFHLSYPLIIRHQGEIYMLPEMSGAGRVQLFRAAPFPDRWVPDRILLDGIVASDATPIFYRGRWWLFATLSDDGGSTWDQLGIFHAPDLLSPWTAHPDNPVLVDAGAARPAGAMWIEGDTLMRVAQDCRTGYGVGLAIALVDRLDPEGFAQSVVARLEPPAGYGADGVHTLNRLGNLETVDLRFSSRS